MEHQQSSINDKRPEFMIQLGLLPPYSFEDVKQAYFSKARSAHPDHGGDPAAFNKLRQAYTDAQSYVQLHTDRRGWIARKVDELLKQESIADRLAGYGAEVTTDDLDWINASFGDFSVLTEAIVSVSLGNSPLGDEVLRYLVSHHRDLFRLKTLVMAGSQVSDGAVLDLRVFRQLVHLDLSGTNISRRALAVVGSLPALETLQLERTSVGWWSRRKAHRHLRRQAKLLGLQVP